MKITRDEMQTWVSGQLDLLFDDGDHSFTEGLIFIVDVHYHGDPDEEDIAQLPGYIDQLAGHVWPNERLAKVIADLQASLDKRVATTAELKASGQLS